jgi:hypothetical protein
MIWPCIIRKIIAKHKSWISGIANMWWKVSCISLKKQKHSWIQEFVSKLSIWTTCFPSHVALKKKSDSCEGGIHILYRQYVLCIWYLDCLSYCKKCISSEIVSEWTEGFQLTNATILRFFDGLVYIYCTGHRQDYLQRHLYRSCHVW